LRYGSTEIDAPLLAEISATTRFVTTIFLGRGQYAKHECGDLSEARAMGVQMAAHYRNGRIAMVYALLSDDRQVFVPDNFQQGDAPMTNKPHAKRFNAQRAARSALGQDAQEGKEFTTVKNEDGLWEWIRAGMPEESATAHEVDVVAEVAKVAAMTPEEVAAATKANKAKVRAARKTNAPKAETATADLLNGAAVPKAGTKRRIVFDMMRRKEGATQKEIVLAGGIDESMNSYIDEWSKKYGLKGSKAKVDGATRYYLADA